ncbi:polysaccharide deacetylase family protein [Actinomadura monticuli]|uniref:Polysaccharide deacetylase family protein n=1 Tax=Actinomadura monticuli TaxID=3097367 RepID=A0ABV4QMS4_9ACTN
MDGPNLVRRGAAAVLAAAVFGGLSTWTPDPGRVELAAAPVPARERPKPKPKPESNAKPKPESTPKPPPPDCSRVKCVALTFDDGPAESTGELLDVLAAKNVRATFFLVGENVVKHPELVRRELQAGHEIGDHSYTHADLGTASKTTVMSELTRTQDAIRRAAGFTPVLLRPPYGSVSKRLTKLARSMGLAQVLWTVDPLDWEHRDTGYVEKRVLKRVRPGYVVLMHDIHPTTVRAVPRIIDRLAAEGYAFVTVSELYGGRLVPGREYGRTGRTMRQGEDSGAAQGLP